MTNRLLELHDLKGSSRYIVANWITQVSDPIASEDSYSGGGALPGCRVYLGAIHICVLEDKVAVVDLLEAALSQKE